MSRGSTIVLTANPKGNFWGGVIGDTSAPGTIMQVQAGTAMKNGLPTWVASAPGTDGDKVLPAVLMEDRKQGKTITDVYVSGRLCEVYCLLPGDMFNGLVGEVAGTGNSYQVGDRLMIDAETGILVPEVGTSTIEDAFAVVLEDVPQVAGSTLVWLMKL